MMSLTKYSIVGRNRIFKFVYRLHLSLTSALNVGRLCEINNSLLNHVVHPHAFLCFTVFCLSVSLHCAPGIGRVTERHWCLISFCLVCYQRTYYFGQIGVEGSCKGKGCPLCLLLCRIRFIVVTKNILDNI